MDLKRALKGFTPTIDRRDASPLSQQIQRSLDVCWKEGMVAQVMLGILDTYLIPFALYLGASPQQIGWFVSIPNLLSSVSQFLAVPAVRVSGSRRRVLVLATAAQVLVLFPIGFLPFLSVRSKMILLTALISVFRVLGSILGPAWGSLVSEYLPENRRGKYFGMRSRLVGIAGLSGVAIWGSVLSLLNRMSNPAAGFAVLFIAAAAFRLLSLYLLSRMVDLPYQKTPESDFTFWMFIRRFRESNFVRFILYVSSLSFAAQLAAPFLSVYMLNVLKFDYLGYTAVNLASTAIGFIAFPIWGRHADVTGNARILKNTSLLIPFTPLLWILARAPYQLMLAEMASGFVWAGFNLCMTNFIYEAVSPEKRVRCLGYFNLINGAALFLGGALGGFLAERLPVLLGSRLISLFLLSAALRFAAHFFLSGQFAEVRKGIPAVTSSQLFFSVVGLRPLVNGNEGLDVPLVLNEADEFRPRSAQPRRSPERPTESEANRSG